MRSEIILCVILVFCWLWDYSSSLYMKNSEGSQDRASSVLQDGTIHVQDGGVFSWDKTNAEWKELSLDTTPYRDLTDLTGGSQLEWQDDVLVWTESGDITYYPVDIDTGIPCLPPDIENEETNALE